MLANLYFHYIYPGFYKVIAPVEVKLLLCIVVVAAVLDLVHRLFFKRKRSRTESAYPTQYMNGHVQHSYYVPLQHRTVNNNSAEKLLEKV